MPLSQGKKHHNDYDVHITTITTIERHHCSAKACMDDYELIYGCVVFLSLSVVVVVVSSWQIMAIFLPDLAEDIAIF